MNSLNLVISITLLSLGLPAGAGMAQTDSTPTSGSQRGRLAEVSSPAERATSDQGGAVKTDERIDEEEPSTAAESEVGDLRKQIDTAPNAQKKAELQFKLVERLLTVNMKQQAIAELNAMTTEDRFDPQGFYNIGNALARLGESDGAVKAYRKAIEQRKGRYSRALNNLGVVLLRQGRWDEAFDVLLNALRLENFHYAEASYNLGRLYAARGESDLAIQEWRRALAVNPEHSAAAGAIAGVGRGGRNIVVASRSPTPGSRSTTPSPGISSVATDRRSAKTASASSPNTLRLTVDPETFRILQRARTARDRGRNEEAVEDYRRVISRMGGYFPPANLEMSFTLINLKRNDEALVPLLSLADRNGKEFPISHYHIGRIYEGKGEFKLAEDRYSQAAVFFGDQNAQFLLDVSRVREKLGDVSGALRAMEEYIALMDKQGQKPDWSEERLSKLRQQLGALQSTSNQ